MTSPVYAAPTDFSYESSSSSLPNDRNASIRLSKAEVEDLRFSFRLLDVSKTGKVSRHDLVSLLSELSSSMQTQEGNNHQATTNVQRLLHAAQALPVDYSFLTEDDFIELVVVRASSNDTRSEIQKVFDMFSDGKEYITLEDLSRVANDLGEIMSEEELREMITRATASSAESNGKGVTMEQFTEVMNRKLFR